MLCVSSSDNIYSWFRIYSEQHLNQTLYTDTNNQNSHGTFPKLLPTELEKMGRRGDRILEEIGNEQEEL
jgi:hypothetical protein